MHKWQLLPTITLVAGLAYGCESSLTLKTALNPAQAPAESEPSGASDDPSSNADPTNPENEQDLALTAPQLENAPAQVHTTAGAMNPLIFVNKGLPAASCLISPPLPTGLGIDVHSDTCRISGTPLMTHPKTTHVVTAQDTDGGEGTASVDIEITAVGPPHLEDSGSQTFVTTVDGVTLPLTNTGALVVSCTISPALPAGLSLVVYEGSCQITGTPTVPHPTTVHTVTATSSDGSVHSTTVTITVDAASPPVIADASAQNYIRSVSSVSLVFSNTGSAAQSCTISPSLPAGLALSVNAGTCRITGTPSVTHSATVHTVTATAADGSKDTATVSLTVTNAPPNLADIAGTQSYVATVSAVSLSFVNSGSAVQSCSVSPSLPTGLSVGVHSGTCRITGTPSATQGATAHTVTATATGGTQDTAVVSIEIVAASPPVIADIGASQSYVAGVSSVSLSFTNTGSAAQSCSVDPALPAGLSLGLHANSCRITGTPSAAQAATVHTVTATALDGSQDTAAVSITVAAANPPALADASDQNYTKDSVITDLDFVNSGANAASCSVSPALPVGLGVAAAAGTCRISGTPTAASAAAAYAVTATAADGSTDSANVTITVTAAGGGGYTPSDAATHVWSDTLSGPASGLDDLPAAFGTVAMRFGAKPSRANDVILFEPGIGGMTSASTFPVSSDFTVSFWVKIDDADNYQQLLVLGDFALYSEGALALTDHGAVTEIGATGFVSETWAHVAVVSAGGTIKGYLNGAEVVSGNITISSDHILNFGASFNGEMDHIRFYDSALSIGAIGTLAVDRTNPLGTTGSGPSEWVFPNDPSEGVITASVVSYVRTAIADNGDTAIVWRGPSGVQISHKRNGVWQHPVDTNAILPQSVSGGGSLGLAINSHGHILVAHQSGTRIYKSEFDGNAWNHPADANDFVAESTSNPNMFHVAYADNGHRLIAWHGTLAAVTGVYVAENRSGSWAIPATGSDAFNFVSSSTALGEVAMNSSGETVIAMTQDISISKRRVCLAIYQGGVWTKPTGEGDCISPDGNFQYSFPKVSMTNNGKIIVGYSSNSNIFISEFDGSSWTHPADENAHFNILPDHGYDTALNSVHMIENGDLLVFWSRWDTNGYAFQSRRVGGVWTHPATNADRVFSPHDFDMFSTAFSSTGHGVGLISPYASGQPYCGIWSKDDWSNLDVHPDRIVVGTNMVTWVDIDINASGESIVVWAEDDNGDSSAYTLYFAEYR